MNLYLIKLKSSYLFILSFFPSFLLFSPSKDRSNDVQNDSQTGSIFISKEVRPPSLNLLSFFSATDSYDSGNISLLRFLWYSVRWTWLKNGSNSKSNQEIKK